jgi:ubiquinone/menaquinone biosynthesis C-methylase UbiE
MGHLAYDNLASGYDSRYNTAMCYEEDENMKASFFSSPLKRGIDQRSILDIGSGTGLLLNLLGEHINPKLYTGIDISPEMTKLAMANHPEGRFLTGGAESVIRELAPQYSIIASLFSTPYFGTDAVDDIFKRLEPNGYFYLVYYRAPYLNPSSVYANKRDHFNNNVLPQVEAFVERAKHRFSTLYDRPLTASGAYSVALFEKN